MVKILNIIFLISFLIIIINCIGICNKLTNVPPESEFHCSGLKIDSLMNMDDKYCCYWSFKDNITNKIISRCSSIDENQYNNLDEYILNKRKIYNNLDIKCVENQKIFCNNIVLNEEEINDCKALAIPNSKDIYCCRWKFEDSKNYNKKNNYCASINKFEYLNIKKYVEYKNKDPEQRYENLEIECLSNFISDINVYSFLLLIIYLFL